MTLSELFGESVLVTVLDFFLENRFWDYSKTDVAKQTGKSRQGIYNVWSTLEKYGIVTPSRKIGGTTLYKLNSESLIPKSLSNLSLSLSKIGD